MTNGYFFEYICGDFFFLFWHCLGYEWMQQWRRRRGMETFFVRLADMCYFWHVSI